MVPPWAMVKSNWEAIKSELTDAAWYTDEEWREVGAVAMYRVARVARPRGTRDVGAEIPLCFVQQ